MTSKEFKQVIHKIGTATMAWEVGVQGVDRIVQATRLSEPHILYVYQIYAHSSIAAEVFERHVVYVDYKYVYED